MRPPLENEVNWPLAWRTLAVFLYALAWLPLIGVAASYAAGRYANGSPNRLPKATLFMISLVHRPLSPALMSLVLVGIVLIWTHRYGKHRALVWLYVYCLTAMWFVVLILIYLPLIIGHA